MDLGNSVISVDHLESISRRELLTEETFLYEPLLIFLFCHIELPII